MERTIRIAGSAERSVMPDTAVIHIRLTLRDKEYNPCVQKGAEETEAVRRALVNAGFEEKPETLVYSVDPDYTYIRRKEKGAERERVQCGYVCCHHMCLRLDMDARRLGLALDTLNAADCTP